MKYFIYHTAKILISVI